VQPATRTHVQEQQVPLVESVLVVALGLVEWRICFREGSEERLALCLPLLSVDCP
jgi:hypothetical protein